MVVGQVVGFVVGLGDGLAVGSGVGEVVGEVEGGEVGLVVGAFVPHKKHELYYNSVSNFHISATSKETSQMNLEENFTLWYHIFGRNFFSKK